jgi:signal transduction histidine kinase
MQNVPFNLDDVIINAEFRNRPSRPPDYKAERDALIVLSQSMADAPQMILRKLVETALHLCHAETAGISLLENHGGEEKVSWEALAGVDTRHDTMPRHAIEDAQFIREAVNDVAALVQQLLTIARKAEVKFDRTDINALVRRLTKLLAGTFPNRLMISLELDPGVPNLQVDANQLNQALLNLCINARDAMPDGGNLFLRTRSLSGAELCDRFREIKSERYVCISVADTGLGMTEDIKSRVFEPFFTTKEPGKGTGLGLSVVYGIVSNQNGFIDVTTEPSRGSTFHIYLPVPKDQAALVETTINGPEAFYSPEGA